MEAIAEPPSTPLAEPPVLLRPVVLELALHPDEADRLPPLLRGHGRRRTTPLRLTWHDAPDFALAGRGLALVRRQQGREAAWRLERLQPAPGPAWGPGQPAPVLAEAVDPQSLGTPLPASLLAVAGFEGQLRTWPAADGVDVTLISGVLRAAAASGPCCRVVLAGPAEPVAALADRLTGRLRLQVPTATLAAEAHAVSGHAPPARRAGVPTLAPGLPVGEAFAQLVAQLTDTMLREAAHAGPEASEPVHQIRVAVRRLRSAVGLFGKAVHCPELAAGKAGLKALNHVLAPARDWDVFVAGTGRAVAAGFAEDEAVRRLLNAAERRRLAAYAALHDLLDSAAFRRLGITLALLAAAHPWEAALQETGDETADHQADLLSAGLAAFAARALERRLRPLREPGGDIDHLPPEALHGLRLHGKRLRYAAEFFAPLFPGRGARRYIRRLAVLQERLGHLNDGAVAATLMAEVGAARSYAGGVVSGFVAAQSAGSRLRIGRTWRKFHRMDPFWA